MYQIHASGTSDVCLSLVSLSASVVDIDVCLWRLSLVSLLLTSVPNKCMPLVYQIPASGTSEVCLSPVSVTSASSASDVYNVSGVFGVTSDLCLSLLSLASTVSNCMSPDLFLASVSGVSSVSRV